MFSAGPLRTFIPKAAAWLLGCGVVASPVVARAAQGTALLDATPVRVQVPLASLYAATEEAAGAAACTLGTPEQCFTLPADVATGLYLGVASFFDRRQNGAGRSFSDFFLLKLVTPASGERVVARGVGYYARPGNLVMRGVGVVKTAADAPSLPATAALLDLQATDVPSQPVGSETCVEFRSRDQVRLEPGEAAWVVLQFPDLPETQSASLLVDNDAEDLDCDFFTTNAGRVWYRPDPRAEPKVDWAITLYTEPVPAKEDPARRSWTLVRRLYR